jgi:hypothetical protein
MYNNRSVLQVFSKAIQIFLCTIYFLLEVCSKPQKYNFHVTLVTCEWFLNFSEAVYKSDVTLNLKN